LPHRRPAVAAMPPMTQQSSSPSQRRVAALFAHIRPLNPRTSQPLLQPEGASGLGMAAIGLAGIAIGAIGRQLLVAPVPGDGIPVNSAESFPVPMGPDGAEYMVPRSMPRVGQSRGAFDYTRAILDDGFHNTRTLGHSSQLEERFAERFEHKYGILYANGTATLHGALLGCGIGTGDEVLVPSFTPFPTAAAVLYCNAIPVIIDVDPDTWTMDPAAAAAAITPRTKAMIPVMINGNPCHMDELLALANQVLTASLVWSDCAPGL
jgi:hypothetical protein